MWRTPASYRSREPFVTNRRFSSNAWHYKEAFFFFTPYTIYNRFLTNYNKQMYVYVSNLLFKNCLKLYFIDIIFLFCYLWNFEFIFKYQRVTVFLRITSIHFMFLVFLILFCNLCLLLFINIFYAATFIHKQLIVFVFLFNSYFLHVILLYKITFISFIWFGSYQTEYIMFYILIYFI